MIVSIHNDRLFGKVIATYQNGVLTTAGLYDEKYVKPSEKGVIILVTYNIDSLTELPADWYTKYWLDDRGQWMKIDRIIFSGLKGYRMEDGHVSKNVSIFMEGDGE